MKNFLNKISIFIGFLFFIFIYAYTLFDAYINIKNKESIVPNLALFFAFFAWRKVYQLDFILKYYFLNKKVEA